MTIKNTGNVGLGTSSPSSKFEILDTSVSGNNNVMVVATSTGGGAIMRLTGYGDLRIDGRFYSPNSLQSGSADYAEYFYTTDTDLQAGESVCVDVGRPNAVQRCARGADNNLMGIVSTKPAIIGNSRPDTENNEHYKIIALLGQIPACVTDENGPIRPGDALTSASSTPGCAARAQAGDPTVGVALENLASGQGTVNVLISRRNKSLTVDMVEEQITSRIAAMEIEDEVKIMIAAAVDSLDLNEEIRPVVDEQISLFDTRLTVALDESNSQIITLAARLDSLAARVSVLEGDMARVLGVQNSLENQIALLANQLSETAFASSLAANLEITADGHVRLGKIADADSTSTVEIIEDIAAVEIVTAPEENITALVVNQAGTGNIADFRAKDISVVSIADSGQVSIAGELSIDGRLLVCAGGACDEALEAAVDETMGDLGVEGKVVAGAFEHYCPDGFVWVPGSAKYGTLPGFCVMADKARFADADGDGRAEMANIISQDNPYWTAVSQGQADLACQSLGADYHLVFENEWLSLADNIIKQADNDADPLQDGLQFALGNASGTAYILSNHVAINNLVSPIGEWTDKIVTAAGMPAPLSADWQEYGQVLDYQGLEIAPPYYYSSANNIGRLKNPADGESQRAFVRGIDGLFSLDLSFSPASATSTIGFRCAK